MPNGKRYKITNTTVKPVKLDKNGRDIRPLSDRIGRHIQFANPRNSAELLMVRPKGSVVVDELNNGILGLYRRGLVGVTEVGDIAEELKKYAFKKETASKPQAEPAMMAVETPVVDPEPGEEMMQAAVEKEEPAEKSEPDVRLGKSTPMGDSRSSEEKLVNPDGEPNFVAKAPKGGMKKSRKKAASIMD